MTWNHATAPAWFRRAQWKAAYSKRNGVHYVGDTDVIIDLTFAAPTYNTFETTANFEGGASGDTLTTTTVRPNYTPYTFVVGSPQYSSTHAYGDLSMKVDSADEYIRWDYSAVKLDQYGRFYLYATANPSTSGWLMRAQGEGLFVNSTGQPFVSLNFTNYTMTNSIALNQWVRIEWHSRYDAVVGNRFMEFKLFNNPDSTTPTETKMVIDSTRESNGSTQLGITNATAWGSAIWFDNCVANADSYPGPYLEDSPIVSPVTYTVRDYFGNVVSAGTFEESHTWFRPEAPGGGWKPGWYRVYLTGEQVDANKYDSYGVTNFCVIKDDAHFVSMPAGNVVGGYNGEAPDYVMKGVMGMGTSRFIINDAEDIAVDLAAAEVELALTRTYWCDNGIPDSARFSREPWCTFPNGGAVGAQLAGVTAVVAALYPDCKYFEGPINEPAKNAATAALMEDFADAVHAGHPDAKAIGPCFVDILDLAGWDLFLAAGGGDHCDAISFHAYNSVTNGDMNLGKYTIPAFLDLLESYDLQDKELWQTESVQGFTPVYGIYHPRRARKPLMETLLFERYGVPRERDNQWYDLSHGFWDFPSWFANADGSVEPQAVLTRVLAEETWGKTYTSELDFGALGNAIYLGHVYENAAGEGTLVLMATSYMTGASIALTITGTSGPMEVVDGFGNERSMPLSRGRITLPMTELPMYVRLPVDASASVYRINGHSPLGMQASIASAATTKQIDGVTYATIADNGYETNYGAGTGLAPHPAATLPSNTTLIWPTDRTIERVIIWCGPAWQESGTLIDFDVETYNGSTWTLRKTVTKPTPEWFDHGSDGTNSNCFQETYWDEQWVFDVELDVAVTCQGVRLIVRDAAYGGEPLSAATIANDQGGGQGSNVKNYRLQEIAVVDANRYAGVV